MRSDENWTLWSGFNIDHLSEKDPDMNERSGMCRYHSQSSKLWNHDNMYDNIL